MSMPNNSHQDTPPLCASDAPAGSALSGSATSTVAVAGAGLVGASAALVLARQGFAVTLIEPRPPQLQLGALGMDLRHIALSPASQELLQSLDVWQNLNAVAYQHMHVWEQWGVNELHFDATESGQGEIGWLVGMSPLACALWQVCQQHPLIDIVVGAIQDLQIAEQKPETGAIAGARNTPVKLQIKNDVNLSQLGVSEICVDFLLAADGAHSTIRRLLGLDVLTSPTGHFALATAVRTEASHQFTAWQRFLLDGPVAMLPGPDEHLSSIVWSQSEQNAWRMRDCSDLEFCRALEYATESKLGKIIDVDQRIVFPINQQRVKSCIADERVLFIGDAMRVVHPLAGLGVNLGFEDVVKLATVTKGQTDLGKKGLWQSYDRQRQARSRSMIRLLDTLQKFYAQSGPLTTLVRNLGIGSIGRLPALKLQIMREAQGLGPLGN